jgi:uncharacterized protein
MKSTLNYSDVRAAVYGGAILGGGGGGLIEEGERLGRLAFESGTLQLWSADEFDEDAYTATVALVGAPGAKHQYASPAQVVKTVQALQRALPPGRQLVCLNTNENGAQTTVNGWFQSTMTGLPVIDLACNGRAHPVSLMGSLGLHLEDGYLSIQSFAGGRPEREVEGVTRGRLASTSGVVRGASIDAGGLVAVTRNPVTVGYAREHGAPGAISQAIELGHAFLDGGVDAACRVLGGRIVAEGRVRTFNIRQEGGLDLGTVKLDDDAATTLLFVNEYLTMDQDGRRAANFPDLIMTFTEDGSPVVSAHVREGMTLRVLHVPRERLLLSRTMHMAELYQPLEKMLGTRIAQETGRA